MISISGSKKTNSKARGRVRVRLSLRREGISGRTNTTIIDPKGILLDNLDPRLFRWLTLCSENQCIRSWKRSRMSHTSNGQKNGRRPLEVQPEPPLPILPSAGAYHRGLQNSMEPSGATGQRGKVTVVFVSAQWARRLVKVRGLGEHFFKAPVMHN